MLKARPAVPAAVLTAALALTTSACGNFASAARAQNDPLNGMSGTAIAKRAMTDTEAAAVVRINGTMKNAGQTMSIDLSLVNGTGCAGAVSQSQTGSFQMIHSGNTVWIKADKEFWQTQGGSEAAALSRLDGKYLKAQTSGNNLGALVTLCSLQTLMGSADASSFGTATRTSYRGKTVMKIADNADHGYAYVTDTQKPELISIVGSGANSGSLNFSYPKTAPAITAPPASEVVNGSKYGF